MQSRESAAPLILEFGNLGAPENLPPDWPRNSWIAKICEDKNQRAVWENLCNIAHTASKSQAHAALAFTELFSTIRNELFKLAPRRTALALYGQGLGKADCVALWRRKSHQQELVGWSFGQRSGIFTGADADWLAVLIRAESEKTLRGRPKNTAMERARGTEFASLYPFEKDAYRILIREKRARLPAAKGPTQPHVPAAHRIAKNIRDDWQTKPRRHLA